MKSYEIYVHRYLTATPFTVFHDGNGSRGLTSKDTHRSCGLQ